MKTLVKVCYSIKDYIRTYYLSMKYHMRKWSYPFSDLKCGIGNLIVYFNIIWNDRDWDYHYWLKMNRLKLSRMEKLIRNHGIHLYAEKDADRIHKAVMIIDRILEDDYHELAFRSHDKKWGELSIDWIDSDNDGYKEAKFNRPNVDEENEEQERKEFLRWTKHSEYLKKQDLKYLTDIINKYLYSWWD